MTFLIVEDDRSVSDFIENTLNTRGHHCVSAATTREADLVLATVVVHAMTLDLGLPGQSAIAWLEEIALARPDLARNTLVITGRDPDDEEMSRIEKAGATLRLKPCPGTEILEFFENRFPKLERRSERKPKDLPPFKVPTDILKPGDG